MSFRGTVPGRRPGGRIYRGWLLAAERGRGEVQAAMSDEHPQQRCTLHEGNIGLADDCRRVVREVVNGGLDM